MIRNNTYKHKLQNQLPSGEKTRGAIFEILKEDQNHAKCTLCGQSFSRGGGEKKNYGTSNLFLRENLPKLKFHW